MMYSLLVTEGNCRGCRRIPLDVVGLLSIVSWCHSSEKCPRRGGEKAIVQINFVRPKLVTLLDWLASADD